VGGFSGVKKASMWSTDGEFMTLLLVGCNYCSLLT